MKLKAIIVDDESLSRKFIKQFVDRTDFLELQGTYGSASEVKELLTEENIDLIFLDIEMPGMSGIDLIRSSANIPQVILITAHKEFASEAFEYDVTDYLVKPIQYSRFLKAVTKARDLNVNMESAMSENEDIFVKVDSRILKIRLQDILFLEAYGDYVKLYQENDKQLVSTTLINIEKRLPLKEFIRVHRKYIVQQKKITEIRKNHIIVGEHEIPVSRSYRNDLLNRLNMV